MATMSIKARQSRFLWQAASLALFVAVCLGAVPAFAQQYKWSNEAPDRLRGTWVLRGERCEDPDSQLAIFSDGGYRWRKSRTDWGFARGKYSYLSPVGGTIYFRLQRFIQQDEPDFSISVSGIELKKYSYGSGDMARYDKCRK
jgi:hypothetical protein